MGLDGALDSVRCELAKESTRHECTVKGLGYS